MDKKKYHRGRRIKKSKQKREITKITGAIILCLFVMLFVQMTSAKGKETSAQIMLSVNSTSIMQNEAVPPLTATAVCSEDQQEIVLNKESEYTVGDLIQKLNRGEGYSLVCEADGKEEGRFPVKLELTEEFASELKTDYSGVIYLNTADGYLKVKNPLGEWDGKKFKRYDGSYVQNDFVESKGKTYYFGDDGKKVSGWQDINGLRYHFTDKGVMEKETWKKLDDGKCYLGSNGAMVTGWMTLGEDVYYFGDEGIMATGKQQIGTSKCKFDDDGKLVSRESKIDPDKPMMALTFDDGPGERTGEILDILEKYDAHATFFMQGKNVSSNKKIIQRMKDLDCELGNHSYDHPEFTKEADGGSTQVGKTNELLKEACGQAATVMRPPYGAINDTVSASVGMPMILWNVDTLDWKTKNTQMTIDNVLANADDGDIVLMHDIHSTTVDAVIELIPKLITNGYQLVTVSEMAEARGIILENGVAYTDFNK